MLGCHSPFWIGTEGFSLCTRTHILQPAPAYFIFSALLLFALTRVWKWYKAHYAHGRIHLDLGQQKDSQTPTQSAVQEAENVILEKSAIDEELNILDSLNLKDQLSVIDPPSQNSKWSAGAALVLTVSWSLPVLLVISTTQPGHSYAPLLGLSSLTMAAWLSIAIRRCTDYLAIFGLVLVYSILQSITAFAELRAVLSHPDRPCIFQALFLGLSLIQLLGSLTARTADHTIQKRLAKRSGISPPELCRPSILSTGYLYYVLPTIRRAAATPGGIEPPLLTPDLATASILTRFRALGQHGPLTRRLLRFLFADWMLQVFWCAVASLMSIGPLFFMRALLNELAKPSDDFDRTKSAILALLIPSFQALKAVFDGLALIKGRHMCVKARAVCSGEIYAKTLRRQDVAKPAGDESSSSAGRISNMVSADVMQVSEVFAYLHFLFPSVPIIVGIDLWLLFDTLGKSAFIGIGVLLFLTPFQFIIGRLYNKLTSRILNASDKRLHLLQEVLHGIKLIRFFAWSESFADRLARLRQTETNLLLRRSLLESALEIVYMSNAALIGILTFYFHTRVFGHTLTSASAFTTVAAFDMLKHPMEMIADMLASIFQARISLNRIAGYLEEPDTNKWDEVQAPDDGRVGFSHASFDWGTDGTFALRDLDLLFPEGKLSLVAGPVGSGKSALLLSLLGELRTLHGKRHLPSDLLPGEASLEADGYTRSVAYCAQTAFLMSDSVRNNIVFGTEWDELRYRKVIQQCALTQDLQQLPSGDQTLIGERGTVLSGGQKMRVALARALYSYARTLLFDDVLAAVDAQTAHLLVETLSGDLVKGRTCILVTHALPLCLSSAEFVVMLDRGNVSFSGKPNEASKHLNIEFSEKEKEAAPPLGEAHVSKMEPTVDLTKEAEKKEEVRSMGSVSWDVYQFYINARGGLLMWAFILSGYGLSQLFDVMSSASLANWARSFQQHNFFSSFFDAKRLTFMPAMISQERSDYSPDHYMNVYMAFSIGYIIMTGCRSLTFRVTSVFAARRVYNRLSAMVLGAQTRFFDVTPVGQIVNRMSRDTKVVDSEIGSRLNFLIYEIAAFTSVLIAIASAIPQFLLVAVATSCVYFFTIRLYLKGSREFKRLESVTRSPIFSLFGETMTGSITIRAYAATSRFLQKAISLQNENSRPFYTLWLANRWLSVSTELESAATVLGIALVIVMMPGIDSATAGFCLSLGLRLPERLLWVGRMGADMEIAANSVERVKEYMGLEQEDYRGLLPPPDWPSSKQGIQIRDLKAYYGPGQAPVLKGLSFDIEPGSKVAIVGRTGSGKSTLALAFFRFIMTTGLIEIDGLDIKSLALDEVRRRLTIIAQDATLFSGTIRSNLDPFEEHDDLRLWDVLHRVKLSTSSKAPSVDLVSNLEGSQDTLVDQTSPVTSLDQEVAEGGNNLSQGQRQLVALARGLLKLSRSKLLILDEASASLDADTDAFIQRTLREELKDATLICIAHRLDTIIDYDKVLVLGDGQILEYDSPSALLDQSDGHFYGLCRQAGEIEFNRLKALAKKR